MNNFTIKDISTGTTVLQANYSRVSIKENLLALMIDSEAFVPEANTLSRDKMYSITVEKDGQTLLSGTCTFESYHFAMMNKPEQMGGGLGLTDNTVLFKVFS